VPEDRLRQFENIRRFLIAKPQNLPQHQRRLFLWLERSCDTSETERDVLADLNGPGVVTHIWITVAANEYGWPRLLRLRAYYDDSPVPSVDCPGSGTLGGGVEVPGLGWVCALFAGAARAGPLAADAPVAGTD